MIHENDPQLGQTESDVESDTRTKSMEPQMEHFSGSPSGVRVVGIFESASSIVGE
jgi:hypothetical protein